MLCILLLSFLPIQKCYADEYILQGEMSLETGYSTNYPVSYSVTSDGCLTIYPTNNIYGEIPHNAPRSESFYPWTSVRDNITSIKVNKGCSTVANASIYRIFSKMPNLKNVDVSELDTSKVYENNSMFREDSKLEKIDISSLNFENVTNMGAVFLDDYNLKEVTLDGINTSSVTSFDNLFSNCENLTNINVRSFTSSKTINMSGMFRRCKKLKELDLSSFDTNALKDCSNMFADCTLLEKIYVNNDWYISNSVNSTDMFLNCFSLIGQNQTIFDSNIVNGQYANIDTPENIGYLFFRKRPSANNDLYLDSNFQACRYIYDEFSEAGAPIGAAKATKIIFCYDKAPDNIELITFSNNGDDLVGWIQDDTLFVSTQSESKRIIVSNCVSNNAIKGIFDSCFDVTEIILNNFVTSEMTDMTKMFYNTSKLEKLTLNKKGFDTSSVQNMDYMFAHSGLKNVTCNIFDTSNVISMSHMFESCQNIEELDLSAFDTKNASNFSGMFSNNTKLKTIKTKKDFSVSSNANTTNMFSECCSIVGSDNTVYDANKIDGEYARIGNGKDNFGYFTAGYSKKIINGTFDYPQKERNLLQYSLMKRDSYIMINQLTKSFRYYYQDVNDYAWSQINDDFDFDDFAWKSTQTIYDEHSRPGDVQFFISKEGTENQYAELVADQTQCALYQDVATTPGSLYSWSLKHSPRNKDYEDEMAVIIADINSNIFEENASVDEKIKYAQQVKRVSINGSGDQLSSLEDEPSYLIKTDCSKLNFTDDNRDNTWETYTGKYVVPDGQYVTRFTFLDLSTTLNNVTGNCVDDIFFDISDPLYYDLCGGDNNPKIPIPDNTDDNYPGYHTRGEIVALTDIIPVRKGYTFVGWSEEILTEDDTNTFIDINDIPTNMIIKNHKMSEAEQGNIDTVYAVWVKNVTIKWIDTVTNNVVNSIEKVGGYILEKNDYPIPPEHEKHLFKCFSYEPKNPIISDTIIYLYYDYPIGTIKVNIIWDDLNNMKQERPKEILWKIPYVSNSNKYYEIDLCDTNISFPFVIENNYPVTDIGILTEQLPDISPYSIEILGINEEKYEDDAIITYEIKASYRPKIILPDTGISIMFITNIIGVAVLVVGLIGQLHRSRKTINIRKS